MLRKLSKPSGKSGEAHTYHAIRAKHLPRYLAEFC